MRPTDIVTDRRPARLFVAAALVVSLLVTATGCGSSGSTAADTTGGTAGSAGGANPTAPAAATTAGTLTLVVDGKTVDTGSPKDCNINDYTGEKVFAFTATRSDIDSGLAVQLPPEPGTLGERDGNVILPEPSDGDSFQPTLDVTGSWERSGDTATGHLEGSAKHVSAITATDPAPPSTFTLDFSCKVTEIDLDDVGN